MEKILVVAREAEGMRLDKFLAGQLSFLSRTKIHNLIHKEAVFVDGRIRKPSFHLQTGQSIRATIEEEKELLKPFDFAVKIIHEDKDIIVIDKPTGLTVHPPQARYYKTLVNALLYLKKELAKSSFLRPGVVHRLDKATSGVMVLAKNNHSYGSLVEQFKERKVRKEYQAIVWGKVGGEKLIMDLPLSRDKRHRLKMKVSFLKSKKAYTEAEVVNTFGDSTFLLLKPLTGRMHQIRVQLSFLGFPIVGDKRYGIKDDYKELFLHAGKLGFHHPQTKNFIEFTSSLPGRFEKFISGRKAAAAAKVSSI